MALFQSSNLAKKLQSNREETLFLQRSDELYQDLKRTVTKELETITALTKRCNSRMGQVSTQRSNSMKHQMIRLETFLDSFGEVTSPSDYAKQLGKEMLSFEDIAGPYRKGQRDWSNWESVFRTPFSAGSTLEGPRSMGEELREMKWRADEITRELSRKKNQSKIDLKACQLYLESAQFISNMVSLRILPELQLVESFFQAEYLKNLVLAEKTSKDFSFRYNVQDIKDTIYHSHYEFVRHSFLFYVLSCKVYNTPVLTRLVEHRCTLEDIKELELHQDALGFQAAAVCRELTITRRGDS